VLVVALLAAGLVLASVGRGAYQRLDRDPGRDGDRRVLFVGDSLMFGASSQLEWRFESAGAQTRFVGGYGSGLLSGQGWWVREIEHQVATWKPDVVVIEACCNYGVGEPLYRMPDGARVSSQTDDMYAWWQDRAEAAASAAGRYGAEVFWVTTPAADAKLWPLYEDRIPRFNEIAADLDVTLIDWRGALTPDGTFVETVEVDGEAVRIRATDGLHLAEAGNERVVALTFDVVADALGVAT
jgi:hypothetical protein